MHAPTTRPRLPPEFKLELGSRQDGLMPRIAQVVKEVGTKVKIAGDPAAWLESLQTYLATGEAMIVHARMGRTLVGFLVLDADKGAAPFSWVDQRFRHRGLGERFYSFACINLARPAPEFRFHKDMLEEYSDVLKATGARVILRDSFCVVHDAGAASANENLSETPAAPAAKSAAQAPRRLVIEDGDWVGFSHHDARRLKIRYGRFSRRDKG